MTRFTAGWNTPGCLPEADPHTFPTWEDAFNYLVDEVNTWGDEHQHPVTEDCEACEVETTIATLRAVKADDADHPFTVYHGDFEYALWVVPEVREPETLTEDPWNGETPHHVRTRKGQNYCASCGRRAELSATTCDSPAALITTSEGRDFHVVLSHDGTYPGDGVMFYLVIDDPKRDHSERGYFVSEYFTDNLGDAGLMLDASSYGLPLSVDAATMRLVREFITDNNDREV